MTKLKKKNSWLWASYKNDKKDHNIGVEKFYKNLTKIFKKVPYQGT